jgi:uncharacterized protein DUF6220
MPSNGGAMRRLFEIGTYVLVVAILVQFFLAGLGIFGSASLLSWHTTVNALVIFLLCIALVIVGWLAHEDRLTVGLPGIIVGLVILQSLLLFPYHLAAPLPVRAISALHVVNGVVIFWVALELMDRVRHPRVAVRA